MIENLKNTNLLYVEDDDIMRKQYTYVFKSFFASVTEAGTALESLNYFEKSSFQCIISDTFKTKSSTKSLHRTAEIETIFAERLLNV